MSDPRFFKANGPFTAAYLADFIQAELRGDGTIGVSDVSPLSVAGEGHLSFLDNRKYMSDFASTKAAVIIAAPHIVPSAPIAATLLIHKEPYKAYARIAQLFYPIVNAGPAAISAHAIIDPSATLGANCIVEAGAVISAGAKLGDNVHVAANAVIGVNVEIGDHSTVGIGASLTHCLVGQRVRILPGCASGRKASASRSIPQAISASRSWGA